MKWAIKKGTAFLTMFALLVLMLVPTMSTAASVSPTIHPNGPDPSYVGYLDFKIDQGGVPVSGDYPTASPLVHITVTSGTTIDFNVLSTANIKIYKVLMKGGSQGGNLYQYEPNGVTSDTNLVTPDNPNNKAADISHITFFYKVNTPPPPTPGTITVTKVYSDEKTTPEVSVQLLIDNGSGFVASGSPQTTSGLTTVFNVPDITKTYKVEEAAVPAGYTVSYPGANGQNVVFVGTAATVSILNTLNPTPPPPPTPGTITVTKAYSDQSTGPQVSVRLLINNGEGFEVVGSPQSTIGLTTSFNVPDISKTYKVEEVSVPSGYTVSYPGANGQNVVFTGTTASVSILNTLIPPVIVVDTNEETDINVDTPAAVLASFTAPDPAPPVVVVEQPVPAAAPEIVTVPEEVVPESAPVVVVDEDVPLAAPALPKTGELPGFLFYGLGTMISGLGVYLRRKSS